MSTITDTSPDRPVTPAPQAGSAEEEQAQLLRHQLNHIADDLVGGDACRRATALQHLRVSPPALERELARHLVARLQQGGSETALRAGEALAAAGWPAVRVAALRPEARQEVAAAVEGGTPVAGAVASHLARRPPRHRHASDAMASFVCALEQAMADQEGRADEAKRWAPWAADTLRRVRGLIDRLLGPA
jgi:hypothetical protein